MSAGTINLQNLLDSGWAAVSCNLAGAARDIPGLAAEFARWKAVNLAAAYHHPGRGLLTANPKSAEELTAFGALRTRELLVMYAGRDGGTPDDFPLYEQAAKTALLLFEGKKPKVAPELYREKAAAQPAGDSGSRPAPRSPAGSAGAGTGGTTAAVSGGGREQTPVYSVAVTNELFHLGNVEAWKRIIESYRAKYPGLQVSLYYEGERVDINALFTWGKVKHGSSIQFAVSGSGIRDVAKLRRYLAQGASPRFEAFLKGPVNSALNLF